MPAQVEIPLGLLAFQSRSPDWSAWLDRLPRLVRDILAEWELVPELARRSNSGMCPCRGLCRLSAGGLLSETQVATVRFL